MLLPRRDGTHLANLLKRCTSLSCARISHSLLADQLHRYYLHDTFLCNFLVELYGRLGSFHDARAVFDRIVSPNTHSWNILLKVYGQNAMPHEAGRVFDTMPSRDVVSWTAIIMIFSRHGCSEKAIDVFFEMLRRCITPNKVTLLCSLGACSRIAGLNRGQEIHVMILLYGYEFDVAIATALITMYEKCGCTEAAKKVFGCMRYADVAAWNAMIGALSRNHMGNEAISLLWEMRVKGVNPNKVSFVCVLNAKFSRYGGFATHSAIVKVGLEQDIEVNNALISMYGKVNSMVDAWAVFCRMPDQMTVSWNAILTIFAARKHGTTAVQLFCQMQMKSIIPDKVTFLTALSGCTILASLEAGWEVHIALVESGYESDVMIGNSLISMYGSCHSLEDAKAVFDKSSRSNPVTWSAMIAAYAHANEGEEVLHLFYFMHIERVEPHKAIFVCLLNACTMLGAHEQGLVAHTYIVEMGIDQDMIVENALLNLYGKCGSLHNARSVFDGIAEPDEISWTSMMGAYSGCGHSKEVLDLLYEIFYFKHGKPDDAYLTCVLMACNHDGRIDESTHLFVSMIKKHELFGNKDQYLCMVDLLGRSGCLDAAETLAEILPLEHAMSAWQCVLAACRVHTDVERGVKVALKCLELDPNDAATYIQLSNLNVSTQTLSKLHAFLCCSAAIHC